MAVTGLPNSISAPRQAEQRNGAGALQSQPALAGGGGLSESELRTLAQKVYELLRAELRLEQERWG